MLELVKRLSSQIEDRGGPQKILYSVGALLEVLVAAPVMVNAAWHPLGFVSFSLGEVREGAKLRFHVWPPNERRTQAPPLPIHDHVFELESHVVLGGLLNEIYRINSESSQPSHRVFHVDYDGSASVLRTTDEKVRCIRTRDERFTMGDQYHVAKGIFHSTVVPDSELTATIALTTEIGGHKPKVIGPLHGPSEYRYHREACRGDDVKRIAELVMDAMKKNDS